MGKIRDIRNKEHREAKAWAYDMAASLLDSDKDEGEIIDGDALTGSQAWLRREAYLQIIKDLRVKAVEYAKGEPASETLPEPWVLVTERLPEKNWSCWELTVLLRDGSRVIRVSYVEFHSCPPPKKMSPLFVERASGFCAVDWKNTRKGEKVIAWRPTARPYGGPIA